MYVNSDTIITAACVITALIAIFTAIFSIHRWHLKQEEQDKALQELKRK